MSFVPKSRRARFELYLSILDLNNVPLVSGSSFVKWHLPSSTAAEHRGRTERCPIRDHRVQYGYTKTLPVRLTLSKDGMLQECRISFDVLQEYSAGGRGERIVLGRVDCNLAEYVEASENLPPPPIGSRAGKESIDLTQNPPGVVRRYLMQDSKINSTLKLGIYMRHVEGTREYIAPPLRTAPVFGGIAGIISSSDPVSQAAHAGGIADDGPGDASISGSGGATPVPTLSVTNREIGEMQDMYRRTLAAFWASQPGELKADEAIEDLFSGGDGWGPEGRPRTAQDLNAHEMRPHSRGGTSSGTATPLQGSAFGEGDRMQGPGSLDGHGPSKVGRETHVRGLSSHLRHPNSRHGSRVPKGKVPRAVPLGEIDEFDVREDMKSWSIGEKAHA
ncbi:Hypothetical protein R9X50_00125400 [Acrodontium crateriforme]|uniref:C2 NT-type domain-containing protein n=1 Tax=Acrodontium crateriforme TaxID=150365 RepID=A0AAQ3LZ62_9PEZI|nr:Hypothetical protein R9X50_00125400 [Acrodontium crateriforme]